MKTADLILISGTNHTIKTASTSTYFFHVTNTGAEEYMKTAPIKALRSRVSQAPRRTFEVDYEVVRPFRMKMVTIQTVLGKAKQVLHVIFDINPDADIIELYGYSDFGYMRGGAQIVYDQMSVDSEYLKKAHKLRTIQLSSNVGINCGKFTRRLII